MYTHYLRINITIYIFVINLSVVQFCYLLEIKYVRIFPTKRLFIA